MNIHELKAWQDDARSGLEREVEQVREKEKWLSDYMQLLDTTDELLEEYDRMAEQLERSQREVDELAAQIEQRDSEIVDLRQQLLETENRQLEQANRQLEQEASARPAEIHNHFGDGSSAQVFNDKVTGKILKIKKQWKKREKRQETRRRKA